MNENLDILFISAIAKMTRRMIVLYPNNRIGGEILQWRKNRFF